MMYRCSTGAAFAYIRQLWRVKRNGTRQFQGPAQRDPKGSGSIEHSVAGQPITHLHTCVDERAVEVVGGNQNKAAEERPLWCCDWAVARERARTTVVRTGVGNPSKFSVRSRGIGAAPARLRHNCSVAGGRREGHPRSVVHLKDHHHAENLSSCTTILRSARHENAVAPCRYFLRWDRRPPSGVINVCHPKSGTGVMRRHSDSKQFYI